MQTAKLMLFGLIYCLLFAVFEYINAVNMTSGSWSRIIGFAFKPHILLFFALSPILVWGINKEIYEAGGERFWYTGIILSFVEFCSYLLGSIVFYRKLPSLRECAGLCLMVLALLIAYEPSEHQQQQIPIAPIEGAQGCDFPLQPEGMESPIAGDR
ncbi:MAG: hypothetical protein WBV94_21845 [Blastocatellia bacterium]